MTAITSADLVILGGGPGGYPAAFAAADQGMDVTLIDANPKLGGVCLREGCIPSKTLLHLAKLIREVNHARECGISFGPPEIDLEQVRSWKTSVVDQLTGGIEQLCQSRGISLMKSYGQFENRNQLRLQHPDGSESLLEFNKLILATGSRPVIPSMFCFDDDRIMDSTSALNLEQIPASLLVIGGGYIGLELGSVYAALGSEVTVIEMLPRLLPAVDRDLVRPLQTELKKQFAEIRTKTKVTKLTPTEDSIVVELQSEDEKVTQHEYDAVLLALGRRPNTDHLNLEATNLRVDERGFIECDNRTRTSEENIWAIGDVAGEPMLAHKATHEAKIAVNSILGSHKLNTENMIMPAVIFTDPELAWCGLTETEAKVRKIKVKSFRFPWAASGRAHSMGRTVGLSKIVYDPISLRVLGVGIVGVHAGDLISEGALAIQLNATVHDLASLIHPHPTLSETLWEAAEGATGQSVHFYRKR